MALLELILNGLPAVIFGIAICTVTSQINDRRGLPALESECLRVYQEYVEKCRKRKK